jgi:hypothetical protein
MADLMQFRSLTPHLLTASGGFLQYENPQVQIIVPIPRIESVHKVLMDKHQRRHLGWGTPFASS